MTDLRLSVRTTAGELERRTQRAALEREVQQLVGPISNIGCLSNAELCGIRDGIRRARDSK